MHLWQAVFHVGDFGIKTITIETRNRANDPEATCPADNPDLPDYPDGGFAEVERVAWDKAQQEASGWPSPIELIAIEYIDEINGPQPPCTVKPAPSKPKPKK